MQESGGKITSQIRNLFLTEDSIEKEQKEIDKFFQKYRKIIKDWSFFILYSVVKII